MVSEPAELVPQPKESPFWRKQEELSTTEEQELLGIINMESLVTERSGEPLSDFNLGRLATDMFEEAAKPLGHPSRSYRQDNYAVTGGDIEYPDYPMIPRLMKGLGNEVEEAISEAEKSREDISKIIKAASLAHSVIYIHPFRDFNGRVSRGLTHYVLRKLGYLLPDWQFEGRGRYLDAVSAGYVDGHDFEKYLSSALLSSYIKARQGFEKLPDESLSPKALELRDTTRKLENYI